MDRKEFLQHRIEWANKWLAVPADQLPGALTHDKCYQVATDAVCELIDMGFWLPQDLGLISLSAAKCSR